MILREALRGVIAVVRSDAATTRNYDTANICNGFALDLENLLAQTTDEPCPNCAELRAALAERDAKIREFWNWMDGQLIPLSVELLKNAEARSPEFRKTKARGQAFFDALMKMRELGLITEEPK